MKFAISAVSNDKNREVNPSLNENTFFNILVPKVQQATEVALAKASQGLVRKSSLLLSNLDRLKDALHYRGGSNGETPYFVLFDSLLDVFKSMNHNKISLLRSVRRGDCDEKEKIALYSKTLSQGRYTRKNPYYLGNDAIFYKLEGESAISSIYFMIGYLEVLFDSYSTFPENNLFDCLLEGFVWLSNLSPAIFVSYAKYLTVYPIARYMHQEDMPPIPGGFPSSRNLLFLGKVKKFLRNRIVSFNKKNTSFFQGILQGVKRAAYKVPDFFILKSLMSHVQVLSTPSYYDRIVSNYNDEFLRVIQPEMSWADEMDIEDNFRLKYDNEYLSLQSFSSDFIRMSSSIARNFLLRPDEIFSNKWVPSPNSSNLSSRKEGGQFGYIYNRYVKEPYEVLAQFDEALILEETGLSFSKGESELEFLNPFHDLISYHVDNNVVHEFRGDDLPRNSVMYRVFRSLEERSLLNPGVLPIDKVVALPEPLKVRTITVGDPDLYFASKPFQVALWKHITQFSQFRLASEPLNVGHLNQLIAQEILLMRKLKFDLNFDSFVSGDYKAATDGLDIHFSKLALEPFITSCIDSFPSLKSYFNVVKPALAEHRLCYKISDLESNSFEEFLLSNSIPFTKEEGLGFFEFFIDQKNGQLMGSPLSFPILCIVNMISYWRSMEIYTTKRIKFRDLPVKVNGDDILFRSNSIHYAIWKEQIKFVSFSLSLGKNYIHKSLLTVNSVLYSFNCEEDLYTLSTSNTLVDTNFVGRWSFTMIPYMNPGLLTAQSKGTMRDKTRSLPLSDLYEIVVGGACDRLRAHQRFIHYNLDSIKKMTGSGKFNLFIPVHLGGLGFKVFPEVLNSISFTTFQRRFASFLLFHINLELKKGIFPKKYFSALVDDGLVRSTPSFEKYKGKKELYLEGDVSITPSTHILFEGFELKSAHPLTQGIVVGEPELRYRLPSKSLIREFNRAVKSNIYLPYMEEIDVAYMLSLPSKPQIFQPLPDHLLSSDAIFERLLLRSINMSWDGISPDLNDLGGKRVPLLPEPLVVSSTPLLKPSLLRDVPDSPSDYQLEVMEFFYS